MPRKTRARNPRTDATHLWRRLHSDLKAGRFAQAIIVARQLHAQLGTDATRLTLKNTLVGLIDQILANDRVAEARPLINEAEQLSIASSECLEQLAILRARCGDLAQARQILQRVPGSTALPKVLGHIVDRALRDLKQGRNLLPPDLHAGFDAVVTAFAQYERGEDEAARSTLQAIGMQSPFLEWKLLIRGLMAYAVNDDLRAIENWQRLDPRRLPARMAAPLRYQIDLSFRGTLAPESARHIAQRSDHLSMPLLAALRKVQRLLTSPEHLPDAFRQVRPLIGMLKMSVPQHLPRLASCFYWLIILGGEPDDLSEYEEIFGHPADDPSFHRLIAMVMEGSRRLDEAHREWRQYSESIAAQPQRWPGELGKRARAMIALRMGDNAVEYDCPDDEEYSPENFLDFIRRELQGGPRKSLKPSAESCYQTAVDLAPDWSEPLNRLLDLYVDQLDWKKAETIGRRLVERFPDNTGALIALSNILHAQEKDAEALEALRSALKHNPLDSHLREMVAGLTWRQGRRQVLESEFAAARVSFQESLRLDADAAAGAVKASWAALEFKAGNETDARRIVGELVAAPQRRVATAFLLMAETSRFKSGKATQAEFKSQFESAIDGPMDILELLQLLIVLGQYRNEKDRYYGFGAHEKKILARVQRAIEQISTNVELGRFGLVLSHLRLHKQLKVLAERGRSQFADDPIFEFLLARQMVLQRPRSFDFYRVGHSYARVLERLENGNHPHAASIRESIDEQCDEYPRLRETVERQRQFRQGVPHFDEWEDE